LALSFEDTGGIMKRILFAISAFCFLFSALSADTWLQTYAPFDEAIFNVEDVIVCSDGGYAINGTCIDQQTTIGWGFVIKTDSNGNMIWAKRDTVNFQQENDSRAIVEMEDGSIITASYHYASGTALVKRSSEGEREWANLVEGTVFESFDKTDDGNIIAAGRKIISNTVWPNIIKMNQNGEQLWEKNFAFNSYDYGNISAVIQSSTGGYLLTGSIYLGSDSDILVIKTDAEGDTLWTRILDVTNEDDTAKTIAETNNGDVFIGGYLEGTPCGFLCKLDSEGNTIWFESGTESCGYGFTSFVKSNDNYIVSIFGDPIFDNSLRKFDSNYNIEWTNNVSYYSGHGDKAVQINSDGNIIVVLYHSPYASLVKLNPNGTDINEDHIIVSRTMLKTYPNPFNPTISFFYFLDKSSKTEIRIYNLKGQHVTTINQGNLGQGNHTITWDASQNASGMFFVQLVAENKVLDTKKITLLK
jgi:hypothetical protein